MREDHRIQQYLRHSAGVGRDRVEVPGFTFYFDPADSLRYFNYAIPKVPEPGGTPPGSIDLLIERFRASGRIPRLEWIESFAPGLENDLVAYGFDLELRTSLMTLTADGLIDPGEPAGFHAHRVDARSRDEEIRSFLEIQRQPFGLGSPGLTGIESFRERTRNGGFGLLGCICGEPAVSGQVTDPRDGLTELAGIGTLEPFRRQGFAAAITYRLARAAFGQGADLAFLTPGDVDTARIYGRAGFRAGSVAVAYALEPESGPMADLD